MPGVKLYRNLNVAFEKQVEASSSSREIPVTLDVVLSGAMEITALSEDGRQVKVSVEAPLDAARDPERMLQTLRQQLYKRGSEYSFTVNSLKAGQVPFMTAAFINGIRRDIAEKLNAVDPGIHILCHT